MCSAEILYVFGGDSVAPSVCLLQEDWTQSIYSRRHLCSFRKSCLVLELVKLFFYFTRGVNPQTLSNDACDLGITIHWGTIAVLFTPRGVLIHRGIG
jgi:hypothetical protein